jgi:hypothetical protein
MDASYIANALVSGRDLAPATLQQIAMSGDDADRLYVALFRAIRWGSDETRVREAATTPPDPPTATAWSLIFRYGKAPTRSNYSRIVKAAGTGDDTSGTLMRLAPLVLARRHRHSFAQVVERIGFNGPNLHDDFVVVAADLRRRGPNCLYAKREAAIRRKLPDVS